MNLQDIKGSYDLIVSLGSVCNPALQLKRLNLKSFTSSPLDWSYSPFLVDVNRLLKNKFDGFMELENLCLIDDSGKYAYFNDKPLTLPHQIIYVPTASYVVQDIHYNIFSAHDFPILPNKHWTTTYSKFKKTLNYKINRFMKRLINSKSILFIRWGANYSETMELRLILSQITSANFKILIINPTEGLEAPSELEWGIEKVCTVNAPIDPNSISTWDYVLNGVTLNH